MGHLTGRTSFSRYLKNYWPFAFEIMVVNAIGTSLRDPMNTSLPDDGWRIDAIDLGIREDREGAAGITRYNMGVERERLRKDVTAEPALRD